MSLFTKDLLERVVWTTIQAVAGTVAVYLVDAPYGWAVIVAAALSALKGVAARKLGSSDSASTHPDVGA